MIVDTVTRSANPEKKAKTVKCKPRSAKRSTTTATSLTMLDACLPEEPLSEVGVSDPAVVDSAGDGLEPWLEAALLGGVPPSTIKKEANENVPLTARLPALTQRMRSLLRKAVYAKGLNGELSGQWADRGRPAGFVGAGLAEELCLAVFGRIQALRAPNVGKQVIARLLIQGARYFVCHTDPTR